MPQFALITASYWAFTLTDGALRMLVLLYFHQLGYSPFAIASLFLFYEFFGVVTSLVGGWFAARVGLARILLLGLALQVGALGMLLVPVEMLSVGWVMFAQALSGIAKDLCKTSAKSGVKALAPENQDGRLYRWVTALTGSKNALKGVGFFLGGGLLSALEFDGAVAVLALSLAVIFLVALGGLDQTLGKASYKPKFSQLLSKSRAVNTLSAARLFLFGARDVWFVVALPVFLQVEQGWSGLQVGTLLACWVIGYGAVQTLAPRITSSAANPQGRTAVQWGGALFGVTALVCIAVFLQWPLVISVIVGLALFGAVFAVNSAVHSYLIVAYADADGASLDVGFYYMANALGRLTGTLLSGAVYQTFGLAACLAVSLAFVLFATLIAVGLPKRQSISA